MRQRQNVQRRNPWHSLLQNGPSSDSASAADADIAEMKDLAETLALKIQLKEIQRNIKEKGRHAHDPAESADKRSTRCSIMYPHLPLVNAAGNLVSTVLASSQGGEAEGQCGMMKALKSQNIKNVFLNAGKRITLRMLRT